MASTCRCEFSTSGSPQAIVIDGSIPALERAAKTGLALHSEASSADLG